MTVPAPQEIQSRTERSRRIQDAYVQASEAATEGSGHAKVAQPLRRIRRDAVVRKEKLVARLKKELRATLQALAQEAPEDLA